MNLTFRDKVFHWFLAEENAGGEIPRVTGDVLKACRPYPVSEYFRHGEEMDPAFHELVFMGSSQFIRWIIRDIPTLV